MTCFRRLFLVLVCSFWAVLASAQTPQPQAPAPDQPTQTDPDSRLDPLQPDFNLAALPTTLRMPVHKLAFRVTHRFTRPLAQGDFGDLLSDFFGFDSAAQIGLELRYGLTRGTQIGVHRTSDRDIQIFGQHSFLTERDDKPIGLDALATFEGANNLQEYHRSTLGALVSRNVAKHAALYAEPMYVINSNPFDTGDPGTLMIGLGARVRIRPSAYVVAEYTPRVAGFDPGKSQMSFGFEGRAGGHLFQINFSNGFGTTMGQLANGTISYDNWYIGFNIARKFF